jgi:LuxR family maltose regulon positive regulatory protein
VPIVIVDDQRRYIEANRPARLAFRLSLKDLRRYAMDDLAPTGGLPAMKAAWGQLLKAGSVDGPKEVVGPDGSSLEVVYRGMANALPGRHVFAFAPAGWPADELGAPPHGADPQVPLTPRELELLQLAAHDLSGPGIAEELTVSISTVKTHFNHIYKKLGVQGRGGAVAKAMRLGLVA